MAVKKVIYAAAAITLVIGTAILPARAADRLPAFPGAEGGGKYTQGARAADKVSVYHVTSLEDYAQNESEIKGSLRYGMKQSGSIIVFDVSGVIHLKRKLPVYENITVLGQTAPGDGVTITDYDVEVQGDNVILRYLRIRPTDSQGGEPDGLGGRWVDDVVLDHCSVSWGVDELLTLYAGSIDGGKTPSTNLTVQYCISAESMRMSNHIKGAHGYGGIVGGTNATYHHNLFAHHDSRSPRLDRNLRGTDFVNNVIYNWGNTNSIYGGEPYSYSNDSQYWSPDYVSRVNIRGNYYKYGPSTRSTFRSRLLEVTNNGSASYNGEMLKSDFYINGNYVWGNEKATSDNTSSTEYVLNKSKANLLSEPVDMGEYTINMQTAEEALYTTLATVGASLPKRDSVDARIISDVKSGTGRVINNDEEVGGVEEIPKITRKFEIPSDWKTANGMGSAKETDLAPSGYTWIEEYVNAWTASQTAPQNPVVTAVSPTVADITLTSDKTGNKGIWTVVTAGEPLKYEMTAQPVGSTHITRTELYDGTNRIDSCDSGRIDTELELSAGVHYIRSRAYNDMGESTDSPVSLVYVTGANDGAAEIGTPPYPGKSAAWSENGIRYVAGSGFIAGKKDSLSFDKHYVDGDFEMTVKLCDIPKYENGVLCGIMFRESLEPDAKTVMIADTWRKYGENVLIPIRASQGGSVSFKWMKDSEGNAIKNSGSYDTVKYPMPIYLKLQRTGDIMTASVSDNGTDWTDNARQPYTIDVSGWSGSGYVGLAVDSVNGTGNDTNLPLLPWYTIAGFSEVNITGETREPMPTDCEIESLYTDGTVLKADISNSGEAADAVAAAALYDESGALTAVKLIPITVAGYDMTDIEYDFKTASASAKLFLWNSAEEQKPMCEGKISD